MSTLHLPLHAFTDKNIKEITFDLPSLYRSLKVKSQYFKTKSPAHSRGNAQGRVPALIIARGATLHLFGPGHDHHNDTRNQAVWSVPLLATMQGIWPFESFRERLR